jgi:hypothetical protein
MKLRKIMLHIIFKKQVVESIKIENPWWIKGEIEADYNRMHRDWFTPWYALWNKGEVDMIGLSEKNLKPAWALEIKWSNRFFDQPGQLKSLIKFCAINELQTCLVTTINQEGTKKVNDFTIQYFPASALAYTVGRNKLDRRGH